MDTRVAPLTSSPSTGSTASSLGVMPTPVAWTMTDALLLVRTLQPRLHAHNWHVALGGSVLNTGRSDKDLDLFFLPFSNTDTRVDVVPMLIELWGPGERIDELYPAVGIFGAKLKFFVDGKRIDAFIGVTGAPEAVGAVDPSVTDSGTRSTRV